MKIFLNALWNSINGFLFPIIIGLMIGTSLNWTIKTRQIVSKQISFQYHLDMFELNQIKQTICQRKVDSLENYLATHSVQSSELEDIQDEISEYQDIIKLTDEASATALDSMKLYK